jgi:hypothetical protein
MERYEQLAKQRDAGLEEHWRVPEWFGSPTTSTTPPIPKSQGLSSDKGVGAIGGAALFANNAYQNGDYSPLNATLDTVGGAAVGGVVAFAVEGVTNTVKGIAPTITYPVLGGRGRPLDLESRGERNVTPTRHSSFVIGD